MNSRDRVSDSHRNSIVSVMVVDRVTRFSLPRSKPYQMRRERSLNADYPIVIGSISVMMPQQLLWKGTDVEI